MLDLFNVNTKPQILEEFLLHLYRISEGRGADHTPWRRIAHPEQKIATSLIRHRNAILKKRFIVELVLSFLKL
jgi:hypothetical protein